MHYSPFFSKPSKEQINHVLEAYREFINKRMKYVKKTEKQWIDEHPEELISTCPIIYIPGMDDFSNFKFHVKVTLENQYNPFTIVALAEINTELLTFGAAKRSTYGEQKVSRQPDSEETIVERKKRKQKAYKNLKLRKPHAFDRQNADKGIKIAIKRAARVLFEQRFVITKESEVTS